MKREIPPDSQIVGASSGSRTRWQLDRIVAERVHERDVPRGWRAPYYAVSGVAGSVGVTTLKFFMSKPLSVSLRTAASVLW